MICYIITGIDDSGKRVNLFKDNRTYRTKRGCDKAVSIYSYGYPNYHLQCEKVDIETNEERLEKENQQLRLELKAEREGNDFYAAPHRYQRGEVFFKSVLTGDHGDMEIFDDVNNCYYQVSGRMARQVQAKRVLVIE